MNNLRDSLDATLVIVGIATAIGIPSSAADSSAPSAKTNREFDIILGTPASTRSPAPSTHPRSTTSARTARLEDLMTG